MSITDRSALMGSTPPRPAPPLADWRLSSPSPRTRTEGSSSSSCGPRRTCSPGSSSSCSATPGLGRPRSWSLSSAGCSGAFSGGAGPGCPPPTPSASRPRPWPPSQQVGAPGRAVRPGGGCHTPPAHRLSLGLRPSTMALVAFRCGPGSQLASGLLILSSRDRPPLGGPH